MDVKKVYAYALEREREGKRFFEENAGRLSHAAAVGAFKELAAEEQRHIDLLQRLLGGGDAGVPEAGEGAEGAEGFFAARALAEGVDQCVLEAMVPDLPVLRMAYLIERDFAEFYEAAASRAEGEAKVALSRLADWERGHERLFRHLHDEAFEEYAGMPWGG